MAVARASPFETAHAGGSPFHAAPFDEPSQVAAALGAQPLVDDVGEVAVPVVARTPTPQPAPRRDATPVPARTTGLQPSVPAATPTPPRLVIAEAGVSSPRLELKKPKTKTEIQLPAITAPPPRRRAPVIAVVALVTIAVCGGLGWWLMHAGDRAHASGRTTTPTVAPTTPAAPPTGSATGPQPGAPPSTMINPADALYHDGMQALDAGNTQKAIATLHRAEDADPAFAPSYRALGLVYERLGDKAAEKAQLVKYLQLAPSAADAPRIRDKLTGL